MVRDPDNKNQQPFPYQASPEPIATPVPVLSKSTVKVLTRDHKGSRLRGGSVAAPTSLTLSEDQSSVANAPIRSAGSREALRTVSPPTILLIRHCQHHWSENKIPTSSYRRRSTRIGVLEMPRVSRRFCLF